MSVLKWNFLAVAAAVLGVSLAIADEDFIKAMHAEMGKCREEFGLTPEDIIAVHETGDVSKIDPCYFACQYRKMGSLNEDGFIDGDAAKEKVNKMEEEKAKILTQNINACSKVNDDEVGDGAKGCERARLFFSCLINTKATFVML